MLSAHRERILNMSFVLRGCQQQQKKNTTEDEGVENKKQSMVILIGTKFATFFSRDSVLSWN